MTDHTRDAVRIGAGVLDPQRDGHCHYYPRADKRWFVTDTYPERSERGRGSLEHDLMLHVVEAAVRIDIGRFVSLAGYEGEIVG